MSTELFQNLIPSSKMTSELTQATSGSKILTENSSTETFSNLLDTAKSKYVSKDSNKENSQPSTTKKETVEHNTNNSKELKNVIKELKKESQHINNKTNAEDSKINNKTTINEEADTAKEVETNDTESAETKKSESKSDINIKLSENILNNILLGNSVIKEEEEETAENNNVTTEEVGVVSNAEDVALDMMTKTITNESQLIDNNNEDEVINSTLIDKSEKNATKSGEGIVVTKNYSETENKTTIDKTDLTIKANDTLNSLKISEKNTLETKNTDNSELNYIYEDEEIENLDNQSLVKVDEVIESSVDELATELNSELKNTTKISQEIIDELDVTVRSVSSNDIQKMSMGNQEEGFSNLRNGQQGNAQENIIKMSVETTNTEINITDFSEISANLTENTDLIINKNIDLGSKISLNNASQPQNISDTEILSQINNKLTLPKDNTMNKVNIILQPEQLGKVSVEIMQTKEGIVAKLVADTVQVKDLLDKSIESLKNTLASQGVNINNISVKVEESSAAQNAGFGFEQEQFNREAANQSNQNQQRNSGNSNNLNEQNFTKNNENYKNSEEEIVSAEVTEQKIDTGNENGSISIMV